MNFVMSLNREFQPYWDAFRECAKQKGYTDSQYLRIAIQNFVEAYDNEKESTDTES